MNMLIKKIVNELLFTRKALLIESSKTKYGDLPGISDDLKNWKNYLLTPIGGAWEENEIEELHTPSKDNVMNAIKRMSNFDYTFIAFSGHGFYKSTKNCNETMIILNDNENITVTELDPKNPKNLTIIDSCRGIEVIKESLVETVKRFRINYDRSKKIFSKNVLDCEIGRTVIFSCKIDEEANEAKGSFTFHLIKSAMDWQKEQGECKILNCKESFNISSQIITGLYPRQHPVFEAARRTRHFPFAISAK